MFGVQPGGVHVKTNVSEILVDLDLADVVDGGFGNFEVGEGQKLEKNAGIDGSTIRFNKDAMTKGELADIISFRSTRQTQGPQERNLGVFRSTRENM